MKYKNNFRNVIFFSTLRNITVAGFVNQPIKKSGLISILKHIARAPKKVQSHF